MKTPHGQKRGGGKRLTIHSGDLYTLEGRGSPDSTASRSATPVQGDSGAAGSTKDGDSIKIKKHQVLKRGRSHKTLQYENLEDVPDEGKWSPVRKIKLVEARKIIRENNKEFVSSSESSGSDTEDYDTYHMPAPEDDDVLNPEEDTFLKRQHHHHRERKSQWQKVRKTFRQSIVNNTIVNLIKNHSFHSKAYVARRKLSKNQGDKENKPAEPFFVPREYTHYEEENLFSNTNIEKTSYEYVLNWPQRIFIFMEHPGSCQAAWMMSILITVVTFVSVMIYVCASVPEFLHEVDTCAVPACDNVVDLCVGEVICEPEPPTWFPHVEKICLNIFVADYFIRFFLVVTVWFYESHIMNLVDLIAILPFFIEQVGLQDGNTLSIIRVLRLARILRVLKLGKGSKGVQVLLATMIASFPAILILGFFSLIGVTLLGALQYFFEGGTFTVTEAFPNGEYLIVDKFGTEEVRSMFNSIPMAMYWSIITSTGVGFGDLAPTTYMGRLIAIIAMYGGILVLALPISVIGNNFERIYDQSKGHLSYGVVNSVLELMEDDADIDSSFSEAMEADGLFVARKRLIEHRASKLACVFVIAHVCLKDAEAEDINVLLTKVGLRDIISALEYVYDLEFRHAQLGEFVKGVLIEQMVELDNNHEHSFYSNSSSREVEDSHQASRRHSLKNYKSKRADAHQLVIGKYEFGKGETKVNWSNIETQEGKVYLADFRELTERAKEVVRYLRKAPHDTPKGWLHVAVAATRKEMGMPDDDDFHEVASGFVDNHGKVDAHRKRINEVRSRVSRAYKRVEMAMHAVEMENNARRMSKVVSSPSDSQLLASIRPFSSASDGAPSTPLNDGPDSELISEGKSRDEGEASHELTPGTDYRNKPSGDTPLPNDSGSPQGGDQSVRPAENTK
eukprot:GSChrysophyteH1.ASY1.ANO1.2192.1 assembled CDS